VSAGTCGDNSVVVIVGPVAVVGAAAGVVADDAALGTVRVMLRLDAAVHSLSS
jgi:hypothetical protein